MSVRKQVSLPLNPKPKSDTAAARSALTQAFRECQPQVAALYSDSRAAQWSVSPAQFEAALLRGAQKRFDGFAASAERLAEYLRSLHAEDLGLACACMNGSPAAWELLMRDYRGFLRATASLLCKDSRGGIHPEELADSLFAELYGLADGKRGERSLLRYFHGRSSLKTWLRAVLAQRIVDRIRETRRLESLDGENGDESGTEDSNPQKPDIGPPALDPHRQKYVSCFVQALELCLSQMEPIDRRRLDLYYAKEKKLAEVGRILGEHESSVSRNLERIRREIRGNIEELLRGNPPGFSEEQIALCFQYAAEDAPIDFRTLFPPAPNQSPTGNPEEVS